LVEAPYYWTTAGSIPDEIIGFIDLPNPSSRNMALEFTQPLPQMSTSNLSGGKASRARKSANLNAIFKPIF
jgi:hypothetical protein